MKDSISNILELEIMVSFYGLIVTIAIVLIMELVFKIWDVKIFK